MSWRFDPVVLRDVHVLGHPAAFLKHAGSTRVERVRTLPPMPGNQLPSRVAVTAADVDDAVRLAISTLSGAPPADWDAKAGSLEWTCWETIEHIAGSLFYYAGQLAVTAPKAVRYGWAERRPDGPEVMIVADRAAGPSALLQVLQVCGAMLAAVVRTSPPDARAHHVFGRSDAEGFAAMGVVETLVHTNDVVEGLGLAWTPPVDLCDRVLARLFPHAPADTDRWQALLWATGRVELPDRPRLTDDWRWHSSPPA
jgi:DinB superfamily